MIKLAKLNSDGSCSSSSNDSSLNSFEFASPLSLTYSPQSYSLNDATNSSNASQSIKLVFKKRLDNQYEIKNTLSSPIFSKTEQSSLKQTKCKNEPETTLKSRLRRNVVKKRYLDEISEVFQTTCEDSSDVDFILPSPRVKRQKSNENSAISLTTPAPSTTKTRKKPAAINKALQKKSRNQSISKPHVDKIVPKPKPKPYCDENAQALEPFFEADKFRASFKDKAQICIKEPFVRVVMNHDVLGLALCEEKTNLVRSKALLHCHLYISNTTPCIYCIECNKYMSVNDFSKHIHVSIDDIDDPFDDDEAKAVNKLLKTHRYSILPYPVNFVELNKNESELWQAFSKKYIDFKNKANILQNSNEKEQPKQVPQKMKIAKKMLISTASRVGKRNSVLSDDEFEMDSTSSEEHNVERSEPPFFVVLKNFREDIVLSDEE